MTQDFLIGATLLAVAAILVFIGLPNKSGQARPFCGLRRHWFFTHPSSWSSWRAAPPNSFQGFYAHPKGGGENQILARPCDV
jgi:hypothetical protein